MRDTLQAVDEISDVFSVNRRVNLQMKDSSREFIVGGFPYTGQFSVTDHSDKPVIEDIEICVALYRVSNIK